MASTSQAVAIFFSRNVLDAAHLSRVVVIQRLDKVKVEWRFFNFTPAVAYPGTIRGRPRGGNFSARKIFQAIKIEVKMLGKLSHLVLVFIN